MLKQMKEKGIIYTGPPPEGNKRWRADTWKNGMQFTYMKSSKAELPHWYYCTICGKFVNSDVKNGTATVRGHLNTHTKGKRTFTMEQLRNVVSKLTKYGSKCGPIEAKDINLPMPGIPWDFDFLPGSSNHGGEYK